VPKSVFTSTGEESSKAGKKLRTSNGKNYRMLGFLDAMKDLNNIPDVNKKSAVLIFLSRLRK